MFGLLWLFLAKRMQMKDRSGQERILIMGVGNILLGDEGIGVHLIRTLEERELPPNVDLLDGGTGGFHLLSVVHEYSKIILIDATIDGTPPGTVNVLRPRYAKDFPKTLSAHDIGLKDLLESASLLGFLPEIHLVTVAIRDNQCVSMDLSPEALKALPAAEKRVLEVLERLAG